MGKGKESVAIVAEIGVNHDGTLDKAKALCLAARDCGADYVKTQSFVPELLALPSTPKVAYQRERDNSGSHFEMLSRLALSKGQQEQLKSFCDDNGIGFFSTPYDPSQVVFLAELSVPFVKVASADIIDLELLQAIAESGIPAIISTGMASEAEIARAVTILDKRENSPTILHAVSMYPTPLDQLHLSSIPDLIGRFAKPVGFSDHSEGFAAAPVAVALGAKMVEKHFTLNNLDPGPDHAASANPETFSSMVEAIREAESMLTLRPEALNAAESDMREVSRKSWVTAEAIPHGTILSRELLVARRPGNGIGVDRISELLGRVVAHDLPAGHVLEAKDIE